MRRRVALLLVCLAAVAVLPAAAHATIAGPTPVLATNYSEVGPWGSVGWLAWADFRNGLGVVWARPAGGGKFRVSPTGTDSYAEGIDGTTLVYSSSRGSNKANI